MKVKKAFPILTTGTRDSFKIDGGMRDMVNRKSQVSADVTRKTATLGRRGRDKHSE